MKAKRIIPHLLGFGFAALLGLSGCGNASSSASLPTSSPAITTGEKTAETSSRSASLLHEVFKDHDETLLWETEIEPGSTIVYGGKAPTQSYDDGKGITYEWSGHWDFSLENVAIEYTYHPQYKTGTPTICTANFYADEAKTTKLYSTALAWGETPEYKGETPTKEATADCTFQFNNTWSPALGPIASKTIDYVAQFDKESIGLNFVPILDNEKDLCLASYFGQAEIVYVPGYHNGKRVFTTAQGALANHDSLKEVYFGEGFVQLFDFVFRDDPALTKIHFPSTFDDYGQGELIGCSSFGPEGWDFNATTTACFVKDGILYTTGTSSLDPSDTAQYALEACGTYSGVAAPDGGGKKSFWVSNYCFYDRQITSLALPDNCVGFGSYAFSENPGLTEANFPASLQEVGYHVFEDCTGLAKVTFPTGSQLSLIDESAFEDDAALTEIAFPSGLTQIGNNAFQACVGLKNIAAGDLFIPSSVTRMGSGVFSETLGLTIHCQAASQPSGWKADWSGGNTVLWGQTS
jgi:hypothetical protein